MALDKTRRPWTLRTFKTLGLKTFYLVPRAQGAAAVHTFRPRIAIILFSVQGRILSNAAPLRKGWCVRANSSYVA
jgi:hypothetical protein